jgi:hypothetical protein
MLYPPHSPSIKAHLRAPEGMRLRLMLTPETGFQKAALPDKQEDPNVFLGSFHLSCHDVGGINIWLLI